MRRIVSVSLGVALGLGCVPALAGAATRRPAPTCRVPHGQAVAARTREAIVYTRTTGDAEDRLTYWTACWRRGGRRTRIAITGQSNLGAGPDDSTAGPLRFAGRFLAVPVVYTTDRYYEASLELSVYDLASGRRFYSLLSSADYPPLLLEAVLLTRDGVVAYTYRDGLDPRTQLVAWAGRRYSAARDGVPRPLDEGPAGSITAIRLTGTTLSWRHDGAPRGATLTRPAR